MLNWLSRKSCVLQRSKIQFWQSLKLSGFVVPLYSKSRRTTLWRIICINNFCHDPNNRETIRDSNPRWPGGRASISHCEEVQFSKKLTTLLNDLNWNIPYCYMFLSYIVPSSSFAMSSLHSLALMIHFGLNGPKSERDAIFRIMTGPNYEQKDLGGKKPLQLCNCWWQINKPKINGDIIHQKKFHLNLKWFKRVLVSR